MINFELIATAGLVSFGFGYLAAQIFLKKNKSLAETLAEETIVKSRQLQATFSASLDGIIIINSEGMVLEFSDSAERIFGHKREDILGKNMAEFIVPERYRGAHNAGMERMRKTGKAKILGQRIEIEAIRANGEEFMSELAISRSPGDNDKGEIFIAFLRDISEAKAAELALKEAKQKAEDASEVKSKFLAAMSHEIRTPFNAVLGILDLLEDTKLNTDQKGLVSTAQSSSKALLQIINDTLDYAKITSGTVDLVNKPFSAIHIFDDVKALFEPVAHTKGIGIKVDTSNAETLNLVGDSGRIKQVLMNFVSNAIKFTPNGNITLQVETRTRSDGKYDLFCGVKDEGIGIAHDKQSALFDEFYMIDATDTREHEGTGLGLAICNRLVQMMEGDIGVESALGDGALFWMSVPLTVTAETAHTKDNIPKLLADISGSKLLLAEDNKTNQMVMTRTLEALGVDLTIVENGKEAVDILTEKSFDLALMDISMPIMGGLQATKLIRRLQQDSRNIPILALTAMASSDDVEAFLDAGMNGVLIKPVTRSKLTQTIAKHIKVTPNMRKTDANLLDVNVIQELLSDISAKDLEIFKAQFHSDLSGALSQLTTALKTHDRDLAEKTSHTIKGLAGTFGFMQLSESAALTNSHCNSDTQEKWVNEGHRSESIGQETLQNIDAAFDLIEVSAA